MMGENIKVRRGVVMSTSSHGVVSAYLHRCPQPGLLRGVIVLFGSQYVCIPARRHRVHFSLIFQRVILVVMLIPCKANRIWHNKRYNKF